MRFLMVVLLLIAGTAHATEPADFAAEVTRLNAAHWTLDRVETGEGQDHHVAITLVSPDRKQAVELGFDIGYCDSEVSDFTRKAVAVPRQARQYDHDAEFLRVLEGRHLVQSCEWEATVLVSDTGDGAVPYQWIAVSRHVEGAAAPARLAALLAARLQRGDRIKELVFNPGHAYFTLERGTRNWWVAIHIAEDGHVTGFDLYDASRPHLDDPFEVPDSYELGLQLAAAGSIVAVEGDQGFADERSYAWIALRLSDGRRILLDDRHMIEPE